MVTTHDTQRSAPPRLAVIGGGPVGLSLALLARQRCPAGRSACSTRATPPRTSPATRAPSRCRWAACRCSSACAPGPARRPRRSAQVHVSQAPPTLSTPFGEPVVHIRADELGVPMLGAVLSYGTLLAPLQQAFLDACATREGALGTLRRRPARALRHRGGRRRDRRRRRARHARGRRRRTLRPRGDRRGRRVRRAVAQGRHARLPADRLGRHRHARGRRCRASRWSASRATARWRCCRCPPLPGADPKTSRAALVWCVD